MNTVTSPGPRRVMRGLMSALSVAVLGVTVVPVAEAQAAGVATQNYRNVSATASVAPTDLPVAASSGRIVLRYADGTLVRRR